MNEPTIGSTGAHGNDGGGGSTTDVADSASVSLEWLSLDDDESVLWAGSPDRRTILPAASSLLLPVLALLIVPFEFVAGLVAVVALSLVTVPVVAWTVLQVRNTDYVVTTSGLYEKRGVLSRDVTRIDFEKVQNTSYNQSVLGTRLGYGTVAVSSAGGAGVEMQFRSIPDPRAIQQLISSHVGPERSDARSGSETTETDDDVLEEILLELRAIRRTLEDGPSEGTRRRSSEPAPPADESVTLEHESTSDDCRN